ncbi:MAG: MFS transporter, partial [Thermomicrobiales bacterium]
FCLALGLGNVMAPATDAIMGAVPEAKAGTGSAMNDVIRQVAGAFSIAIIGSVVNTVYQTRMDADVFSLPPDAAAGVRDSVGAAVTIAGRLPEQVATPLREAAQAAFVDAFGIAYIVAAATALAGAVLVARFMPAHHRPRAGSSTPPPAATAAATHVRAGNETFD